MKKYFSLSTLTCATILLSPLYLAGCETMGGLLGQTPTNRGYDSYNHAGQVIDHRNSGERAVNTGEGTQAVKAKPYKMVNKAAAVPLDAPSVHNTNASEAAKKTAILNNAATVPAPAVMPATAPSMAAPTVAQ